MTFALDPPGMLVHQLRECIVAVPAASLCAVKPLIVPQLSQQSLQQVPARPSQMEEETGTCIKQALWRR